MPAGADGDGDVPHLARRRDRAASSRTTRPRSREGMVVLDAVHQIQAEQANDLAVRWNCKAGKCGSCSAEINGRPRLMCMTRLNELDLDAAGHRRADARLPARQGPGDRRLVELPGRRRRSSRSSRGRPTRPTAPGAWSRTTSTACRSSASASSASSARTSATCCATITSTTSSSARASWSTSRRSRCTRSTPRTGCRELKEAHGIGYCNITKCCTKVCPENITITDNAIIPLKERVVDEFYDPVQAAAARRSRSADGPVTAIARGVAMFELKPLSEERGPGGAREGRALPAAQRAGRGGEHLPRRPARRARTTRRRWSTLLLALTDQFGGSDTTSALAPGAGHRCRACTTEYERAYYAGIICERRAKALLATAARASGFMAYDWLREAMALVRAGRSACGRRATTTRSCAGTPARAS